MTQQPDLYDILDRFLTEPRRERDRVAEPAGKEATVMARRERGSVEILIPDHGLSPENRKRAELWKAIYKLQTDYPELTCRQARRLAGHWTMLRRWIRRDRHLPQDAPAALLTLSIIWTLWLGFGS